MKVLMINGSPRENGNTAIALDEMKNVFEAEGVETEIVQVGNKNVRGCFACGRCAKLGKCVFDDIVNELAPELNKYFTITNMPVASSQYWNSIHGCEPGEAVQDEEGRQTMRTLARNMTFLMKSIALGKEKYGLPDIEKHIFTNFIG